MSRVIRFVPVVLVGLVALAAACSSPVEPTSIGLTSLSESVENGSDVRAETTYVIRDADALRRVWAQVFQGRRQAPTVDFSKDMLVIVTLGEKLTAGHGVNITGVSRGDRGLVVHVTAFSPGADCGTAAVLTYPVAVSRLRVFDGDVRFDFRRTTRPCRDR